MCGRFVITNSSQGLAALFSAQDREEFAFAPSYNVAPTITIPLVVAREDPASATASRELVPARWGLVPSWAKAPSAGPPLINARAETVLDKPSFRNAASRRRGFAPASGYYEWQPTADGKQPYYLHPEDESTVAFAALYEYWPDPSKDDEDPERWLRSCTLLTRAAPDALGYIHDRTPVIIPTDRIDDWIDPAVTSNGDVQHLIDSIPDPQLVPRAVSRRVNSVRNEGPDLIEAVPAALS